MDRVILHVDANSFYASVECAENPEIRNKPVAVVGDRASRRGIVLAANYIAKNQYGIKTTDTIWQAERKCPDLILRNSDMRKYREYSKKLFTILSMYSDYVEPFGCDEAWVELFGMFKNKGYEIADKIRERVKKELNITVSVGVSFNKAFAKLGSDMKKPDAITVISRENYKSLVWKEPVEKLLYVGKNTKDLLNKRAVFTIGDLANADKKLLEVWLGKNGSMLHQYANGEDESAVTQSDEKDNEKSISASTTCPYDLTTLDEVKSVLMTLSEEVASRMRIKNLKCREISIKVRDENLNWTSRTGKISVPTNVTREVFEFALELYEKYYRIGNPVRSIGVGVSSFVDTLMGLQLDLTGESEKHAKLEKLDEVSDILKARFGDGILSKGNSLFNNIRK